jgi:hypothetical protein
MKYILRGYSSAKNNIKVPVTVFGDVELIFRVCGWESIVDPASGGTADHTLTLKVEQGTTRSNTISWGAYSEDSGGYPNWSGISSSDTLCPIVSYLPSSSGTSFSDYPAKENTA